MQYPLVRAEISLGALAHNIAELRRITVPKVRFMAVVKADAYGHGAVAISREALARGADAFGVARLSEAVELRQAGFTLPILIFGYTPPEAADTLTALDLTQTVFSSDAAEKLSAALPPGSEPLKIHLKIDTGMGRLGFLPGALSSRNPSEIIREIRRIVRLRKLSSEGIFTHFAASDSADKSYTHRQFDQFTDVIARLRQEGIEFPVQHAANSGAIIDLPEMHMDMVRAGISMYGLYPSDEVSRDKVALRPVMSLKSTVVQVKDVPGGFCISYGMTYQTDAPTRIASVAVGYADGFSRLLSSRGRMIVNGQIAPIVGRVCMDHTMIDVGHIPDVRAGDEAVVFGRQGDARITADEIAGQTGTINYEVVSSITGRVQRIYLNSADNSRTPAE
jgi:alanine racemase